ncbi:MAG: hypothetical protein A2792_03360 [Sphingomonadales bacterium RIFCSPHIGHO2_01_FULL_65_20]|nr:MAG: hypothetical protein A2792_03360 [Sphingomonadales bacterium RIFCSPHIGHO2_01_FULL_65_20]
MAGPWEKFQNQPSAPAAQKPWERFAQPAERPDTAPRRAPVEVQQQPAEEEGGWGSALAGIAAKAIDKLPAGLKAGVVATGLLGERAASGAAARDAAQDDGFIDRSGSMLERGWQNTAGGLLRSAGTIAPGGIGMALRQSAKTIESAAAAPIAGEKTWDDLKANPTIAGFGQYVVEQGLTSLPEMALLATPGGLAVSATGRAGGIAQDRAENDGREDANLSDLAIGGAAGGASALLDKFGLDTIFKAPGANFATRIGRAAGFEAGTEALQGVIEGVGGSAGTQAGVDWRQIADDAAAGAAAGAGIGGGIRTGIEISSGIGKRLTAKSKREQLADGDVSPLSEGDLASPIPNDVLAYGKGKIAEAEAESIEAAVLQKAGMPGIGADVAYEIPGKPPLTGKVEGAFSEMLDGERVAGIIIRTADGKLLRENFDDIADAGAVVRPMSPADFEAAANAIDAQLAAQANAPTQIAASAPTMQPPVLQQGQVSVPSSRGARFDMDRYLARNAQIESSNNPYAKAKTSSASGLFQFTKATWIAEGGQWGNDPNKPFGGLKPSVEEQRARARSLTEKNAAAVRSVGAPLTDGNLYLAHFLGQGGAKSVLRAPPNTPVSEVLSADQINANPSILKGKTVGDVIAWAAQKMGQPVAGGAMAGGAAVPGAAAGTEYADVDFGTARRAPVAPIEIRTEERDEVITTARDRDVKVRYGVVEARDLVASNTPDGRVNPAYPAEMQPRDRTRASSQMQIQQISSKLRPYWLGRTFRPDDGAPVISPEGVVESGNGRTIAIQQVYQQGGPQADAYRRFVETQGIDTTGMEQPVLVRLRTEPMDAEQARGFAREANMATSLGMAPTEQAFADTDALPDAIMNLYQGGDVDAAANRDFVRRYMDTVMSPTEAANLRRADGSPNPRAFARIRNAMLARAYDNPRLVENLSESNDSNIVAIGGALTDIAGAWSKIRQEIASGQIPPEYDITANINEAIEMIERSRREGRPLVDMVNQRQMFTGETTDPVTEAVLRLMFNRPDFTKPAGRKRVRERLESYLRDVSGQRLDQGNLLGEPAAPDVAGAVRAARGMEGYEDAATLAQTAPVAATEPAPAEPGAPSAGPRPPANSEQDARPGREGVPPQRGEQAGSVTPEATVKPDLTVEQAAPDARKPENLKAPSIAGQKIDDEWTAFAPSSGTLGIPRADMPQVKAEHRGALVNFLNARGIEHQEQEIDPASLKPTQAEFSPAKVERAKDYEGGNRAILVSSDDHVLDGHHQWMAARDQGEQIRVIRLDAPIARLLEVVPEMPSATTAEGATEPAQPDMLGGPTADERRQALERRGDAPMRGRGEQRPAGSDGGLFDTAAPQQTDLLDAAAPAQEAAPAPAADVTPIADQVPDAEREARNRRLLDQAVPATDAQGFRISSENSPGVVRLVMTPELARREALSIAQSQGVFDQQFDAIMAYKGGNASFGPVRIEAGQMENLTGVTPADGEPAADAPDEAAQEAGGETEGGTQRQPRRPRGRRQQGAAQPIEDAGEKIGGARKDQWAERGLSVTDLDGMSEGEAFQYVTKDQVWPKPDYAKMVEEGVDPVAVAMLKLMRDRLAAKPRTDSADGRRAYVEMMGLLREEFGKVKKPDDMSAARDRVVHDRIGWPRGYGLSSTVTPEMRAMLFSVYKSKREPFVAANDRLKARKMVDNGFPAPQAPWASRFEVLTRKTGEWAVYRRGGYRAEAGPFPTLAEAEAAAAQMYTDLRASKKDEKGDPIRPYLDVIERVGADVRAGRDIDSQDFIDGFGFRGVEFGNWLAGDERQRSVNLAFEALHDLAAVLKIPPEALSLGGKLGLAFGARGKGRAAAHYEPGKLVINLSKMSGAGSLAHEWGHALDHYFGELDRGETSRGEPRGASGWYRQTDSRIRDLANLRPEMAQAFDKLIKALFKQDWTRAVAVREMELRLERLRARREQAGPTERDMIKMLDGAIEATARDLALSRDETKPLPVVRQIDTSFFQNAKRLSGKSGASGYWARPTEMFARAFEAYVFDQVKSQGERSDYLVQGVEPDRYAGEQYKGNPYPAGEERDAINQAFAELFEQMEVREGARGPELFSIEDGEVSPIEPLVELAASDVGADAGADIADVRSAAKNWYRANLLSKSAKTLNGWSVSFNLRGMKKTLRGGEYLLRAVPAIRQIIEQGSLVETRPGDQTGTKAMHLFASDVSIDGDVRRVGVFVRETPEGRYQYSLNQLEGKGPAETGRDNAKASIAPASEGTLADLNLFFLDENSNAAPVGPGAPAEPANETGIDPAKVEQFHADLAAQLQQLGLSDKLTLSVVDRIAANPKAAGSYQDGLIRVALASTQDPAFTLNHEAIHALRGLGLFNDMEWATLSRRARDDGALMASIKRRYPDLDADAQIEEAVADMYARWATGQVEAKGFVRAAFERLRSFIEAVRNALRGMGFQSATDIMRAVERGDVGRREGRAVTGDVARYAVPAEQAPAQSLFFRSEITNSPAFRRWFGDSKVTFNDGQTPLVMFHGTSASQDGEAFTMFDTYASNYGLMGMGGYFTADPGVASSYTSKGRGDTPTVYPVYLSIKNPIDMDAVADPEQWMNEFEGVEEFHEGGDTNESWYRAAEAMISYDGYSRWEGAEVMQNGLIAMGYDGITHIGGGRIKSDSVRHRVFIAFDPQQIKSAIGNVGTFDPENVDIRFSVPDEAPMERQRGPFALFGGREGAVTAMVDALRSQGPLGGADPTWKGKVAEAWEVFRTRTQDRYLPLKKAQRIIERSFGKPLADEMDVYRGEELMHGRIAERVDRLHEEMVRPLFDTMAEEDVTIEALESYLYARHAPERNAQIAKINPDMEGAGSGMTDTQAAAIMARIERDGKTPAMERLAARVDAIREATLDAQAEYGLISRERAAEMRATYKHYVPLRGFKEVDDADPAAATRINRSGGGINVRGPEGKRAFGRRSEADSPLAYLLLQAEGAIVRGETNRVAQEFVRLAESTPNPDFWEVQKVTTGRRINPETGLVESYVNTLLTQADAPYTVSAKIDGKERRVTLNRDNPAALRLADAMRRLTESQIDPITKYLGFVNRWLSAVNTRFSPEFVIPNLFRDLQSAAVNMQDVDVPGLSTATAKHYAGALKASMQGAFGKGDGDWRRWYDEFALAGAKTAYAQMTDVAQIKSGIEKDFALAASRAGKDKSSLLKLKRGGKAVIDLVENLNDGVENGVRLAAYRAAREAGLSEKKAASIAKNLTVNFNRRGQMGPLMNAAYLFYNASVQGNVRLMQAIYHSKKARGIVAGIVVSGLMMEMLNVMLSADDDDGESFYDKIPAFEKERNIIIMLPDGKDYVKIPLAYGLNAFWSIGRTAGEIGRRGGDRWQESAANLAATIIGAFNPIGFSFEGRGVFESAVSLLMPTAFDPIVDLSQNKDFMGKPIRPEEKFGPQDPEFRRYFKGVGENWKALTDGLNDLTGGNKVEAGAISVSPEVLEYLANTVFGAAGGFFDRLASIPAKVATGEITANDVPLARKVTGEKSPYQDRATFYERLGEVEAAVKRGNDLVEAEMTPELERFVEDNRRVLTLEAVTKEARKITRQISKDRRLNDGMLEKGTIDGAAHEVNVKKLDEIEAAVVLNYNRQWVATVYKGEQAATQ